MKHVIPLGQKTIGKAIEEVVKKPIIDLVKVSESSHKMIIYNQIWKVKLIDGTEKYVSVQIDFEKGLMIISL